jgi:copper/silver efflux system protein
MTTAIIRFVIRYRTLVWLLVMAAIALSIYAIRIAPLDAIPDISDPQIIVYAKWARSPQLLEAKVAAPVIDSLVGSPGVRTIRATSHMGYCFIYVILDDESQRQTVQQRVVERLNAVRPQLPADATVALGPNASSMGWIYQYALVDRSGERDLRDLRVLNESRIKPAFQAVAGVAEVASVGGLEKQFQLKVYPPLLAQAGISLKQLTAALESVFQETGGRVIEVTNRDYQVRGSVKNDNLDQLESVVIGLSANGEAIRLKDVGYIQVGYDQRRGIADLDGQGEVTGGIVIMEHGRNVLAVTHALQREMKRIASGLPKGVELITTYDRSDLVWTTLRHFFITLGYELAVVIAVTVLFLRKFRTAIAPVVVLLLGTLFTALPLSWFGQTINLFSLAGLFIALGEMADATIVIVENCTAELAARPHLNPTERRELIIRSIANLTRPLLFSLLIILASFLPVFFLSDQEGRLFDPLAYSKTFAMSFSTLLTIFLLPVIILWIFKQGNAAERSYTDSSMVRAYRVALEAVIRYRYLFVALSLISIVVAIWLVQHFQRDFMPELEEGSILYMPTTLPGVPAKEAGWILQRMDSKLKEFPEVARVFGKLGRADTSTDPAPITMIETTILLKPKSTWRKGLTKEMLVAEMDKAMKVTGFVNTWVQPISARVMMQGTGIQTPVGIKVKGVDLQVIENLAKQIEALLQGFPGTKSILAERISDGYFFDVQLDLERLAQRAVGVDEAMLTVRYGIGGDNVVGVRELGKTVTPLSLQYSPEYIDTLEKLKATDVISMDGRAVPLGEVADVEVRKMPEMVRNENGELTGYVFIDLNQVTPSDYVARAKRFLREKLKLPAGYAIEWTGTYEYAASAQARLRYIVPLTLVIIFALLLLTFKSFTDALIIMLSVPFAFVGGVFLQWWLGYSMTTAVIIGYIALFAVAIQTGIIMIVFIRQALANRAEGKPYMQSVIDGSVLRLRPKLMTVGAMVLSLFPIMFSSGAGMEIMKPIAAPTIGGMISSTIYVLFLIPCLFAIGEDLQRDKRKQL